ncbi:hypothetical protein [Parvularcula maris]|uniref:Antibiotic biosynthesis monooxygenase n=1 Tax=Parvularcula maris TaxID=2965077 RepID=A0A9X2L9V5_9PROT|nr:hypothetical protein [Parvularcula maris]MCQ8185589.1 hypothetical protein [Parvularcula maris]
MICRHWRGWTSKENADTYQRLLAEEVIPMIEARTDAGFLGIDTMRRELGTETEFATIIWFESWDAVKAFMGEDYEAAHIPDVVKPVLEHWDERCAHYEVFPNPRQVVGG